MILAACGPLYVVKRIAGQGTISSPKTGSVAGVAVGLVVVELVVVAILSLISLCARSSTGVCVRGEFTRC